MLKLLIVGDRPSSKNSNPSIAFVGTLSHKRLQEWLGLILDQEADIIMINRVDPDFSTHLIYATLNHFKIIACGEEASRALVSKGITNHFKLPHPSGLNRQLNDKSYVERILRDCKSWLGKD